MFGLVQFWAGKFVYAARMAQSRPIAMTKRLERVRALATDLFRLLDRAHGQSIGTRAMAEQIRTDADAVLRVLKRPGGPTRVSRLPRRAV